jgi:hypothetical protein
MAKEEHDHLETYCRKLGHSVPFSYCRIENCSRTENGRLPCSKILDCWFDKIPIQEFVQRNYSVQEQEAIFAPAKSRLEVIRDIAEQIENRTDGD